MNERGARGRGNVGGDSVFEIGHLASEHTPAPEAIEALVIEVLKKNKRARIIGVRVDPKACWVGPVSLELGEAVFIIAHARSLLEFRGYLATHEIDQSGLICLVSVEDRELGLDLRVRLARRGLLALEPRRTSQSRFHLFDRDELGLNE